MARSPRWSSMATAAAVLVIAGACNDAQSPKPRALLGLPDVGTIAVTVTTSGSNAPGGYTVSVDGSSQSVGANGLATFIGLPPGSHTVRLSGVPANCSVGGDNPRSVSLIAGLVAATTFSVSCSAPPPPPPTTGDLTVTTSTSGSNLDADGYTLTLDGGATRSIGVNGSVTFSGLSAGSHTVVLSGVAGNCTVSGGTSRTVNVPAGGTASTSFAVSCAPTGPTTGSLSVTTATSGASGDLDPDGYTVTVDGTGRAIGDNASTTFDGLAPGNHSVVLSGVAGNCTVNGGTSRTVSVTAGSTANTTFSVNCAPTGPTTGSLSVTTATSGASGDLDPDGYTVTLDGAAGRAIGDNETTTFSGLAPGSHMVVLSGVAANCSVSGGTSRTVSVTAGSPASTSYAVSCAPTGGGTGSLTVTTSTTGSSLDPDGYTVTIDGSFSQPIPTNGTVTFMGPSGDHSLALSGVASNCTVGGANPRTVNVPSGGNATTTFSVSCAPTGGGVAEGEGGGRGEIGGGPPPPRGQAPNVHLARRARPDPRGTSPGPGRPH